MQRRSHGPRWPLLAPGQLLNDLFMMASSVLDQRRGHGSAPGCSRGDLADRISRTVEQGKSGQRPITIRARGSESPLNGTRRTDKLLVKNCKRIRGAGSTGRTTQFF
jgi:hypothetical protein